MSRRPPTADLGAALALAQRVELVGEAFQPPGSVSRVLMIVGENDFERD